MNMETDTISMEMDEKKIKLADKCRDFNWILKKHKENKLALLSKHFNDVSFDKFRTIIKCVQEVYENKWDLEIDIQDDSIIIKGVVIHFPEVQIKNSKGEQHTIHDLFVKIIFIMKDEDDIKISRILGGRTSVSYAEYCSDYFHSHLPDSYKTRRDNVSPFYSVFCTGMGHINDFMAEINAETITRERMIPYLVQIISLISWESLEGVPHRKISNIYLRPTSGIKSNPTYDNAKTLKNRVIRYHIYNEITPKIDFKIELGQYVIIDNEKFTKFLTETVELDNAIKKVVMCMQDSEGNYYQYGSTPTYALPPAHPEEVKLIFQGKEIPFKVGPPPQIDDVENIKYFLHPKVKELIRKELEYEINTNKIRQSTIKRYSNKVSDAKKSITSN